MDVRIFTEPQQGASYETLLAVARTAEDCGFDAFFRSDHYLAMGPTDGLPGLSHGLPGPSDAWLTLAALARETSRIRLGTLVSPATFRLPGVLAIQVAQVDQMSGGRAELGLGAGWFEAEHAAYGIPFPGLKERFDRLEEQLAIVTGLWATPLGERFSYAGEHYQVADSPALPKPVQAPVPLIVGGAGKQRTPSFAARFATEFNVAFVGLDRQREQFARVRQACLDAGRDPASMTFSTALVVCAGADDAEVARRAAAIGRPVDDVRRTGLAGSPAEIADKIGTCVEAGTQRLYLQVLDLSDLAHLEFIAAEVLPRIA